MSDRHVAAGRKGGLKGGPRRMALLSAEGRSALGRHAAALRWNGRPEVHQVVRMMLDRIAQTGIQQRLYVHGRTAWFAPPGHDSESRWQDRCVGTYGSGAIFEDVMEDVR